MVVEIFAGISALKAALDIAKTIKDANDVTTRQGIVIKLQEQILSAHEAQFELIERVRSLEKEIASAETWDTEKQRYELAQVWPGAFAYVLKKESAGSEPPHWFCAQCYQNRKKSILQDAPKTSIGFRYWLCHACHAEILVSTKVFPSFSDSSELYDEAT